MVRDIWGANTKIVAEKVYWISEVCRVKELGHLEILPLYFQLDTENYHRRIRITTDINPMVIKGYIDEIEKKVNERANELK
jgi:hypothetical protein